MRGVPALRVAVLAACLGVLARAETSALFPPGPSPLAAKRQPIAATSTCGSPASLSCPKGVFSGPSCLKCADTCPLTGGVDQTKATTDLGHLPQPECQCRKKYGSRKGTGECCTEKGGVDCVPRLNEDAHPATYANDGDEATYWQSALEQPEVELTIDLGSEQEVYHVSMLFGGSVPSAMVLEKSLDGETYSPFQYYARDCGSFGIAANAPITSGDQVTCDTTQVSVTRDQLRFEPVPPRLQAVGGDFARSDELNEFIRARFIRLSFKHYFTPETSKDFLGREQQTFPFYRVREVVVESRCSCNGHGNRCGVDPFTGEGPERCTCSHDTAGLSCDACKPLFNAKPFARGMTADEANECVACECNDHAVSCAYDASYDLFPEDRSQGDGGVCDCQDDTAGQHCDTCAAGFKKNHAVPLTDLNTCVGCTCDARGSTTVDTCDVETGQCECKTAVMGVDCHLCKDGFYGLDASKVAGCSPCGCNIYGTEVPEDGLKVLCHTVTGQCPCREHATGRTCSECSTEYFPSPGGVPGQCTACHPQCEGGCSSFGASASNCVRCRNYEENGQCVAECSTFRFPDKNGVCQPCPDQCAGGCKGANPTVESCTSCKNYELEGECVGECSAGTYPDADHVCQKCDEECLGCFGPGPAECKTCRHASDAGTCVAECPAHKYRAVDGQCQPCNTACNFAHGCDGPRSYQCRVCDQYTDISMVVREFDCVSFCPRLAYETTAVLDNAAETSPVCNACNKECAEGCTGPTGRDCQGACKHFSLDAACVSSCPVHTYVDGKYCKHCNDNCDQSAGCDGPGPSDCAACSASAFVLGQHCLAKCPDGFYPDQYNRCMPCDSNCLRCTGPDADQCSACKKYVLGETCLDVCPTELSFVEVGDSVPTDSPSAPIVSGDGSGSGDGEEPAATPPPKDKADGSIWSPFVCTPCHKMCSGGCTGPTARQCNKCAFVSYKGLCVEECPALTYEAGNRCLACDEQCAVGCYGPGADRCEQCKGLKTGDTCVAQCPIEEYPNSQGDACEPCHPQCSEVVRGCSGAGANQCNQCKNFKSEKDGSCVPACPFGTFRDQSVCKLCHPECDGCKGPSPEQCDTCRTYTFDQTCVRNCPAGTYPNKENTCMPCDGECAYDCAGPDADDCVPRTSGDNPCKFAQSGPFCVPFCDPIAEFKEGIRCKPCAEQCGNEGCTGPTAKDCKACPKARLDGACVAECPNSHFLSGSECVGCHQQCTSGGPPTGFGAPFCTGPSSMECTVCKVAKRSSKCIDGCDTSEFIGIGQICTGCHEECRAPYGCTGPAADQCKLCKSNRVDDVCVAECPVDSMYSTPGEELCRPCHAECSTGSGDGGCPGGGTVGDCRRCRHVQERGVCVKTCSTNMYPDHADTAAAVGGVCKPCDSQCDPLSGCRGPGPDQCVVCANLDYLGECVSKCPPLSFKNGKQCEVCDPNCLYGCTGKGSDECTRQENSFDQTATALGCKATATIMPTGVDCKSACDTGRYRDGFDVCQMCHPLCSQEYGCTGRLPTDCVACPTDSYSFINGRQQCALCDKACLDGCSGPGHNGCFACKGGRASDGSCVASCSTLNDAANDKFYYTDTSGAEPVCLRCHSFCAPGGCTGPGPSECLNGCKAFTTFDDNGIGICVDKCGGNSFQTDFPVAQTCNACSGLCSGGCRDSSPASCVACARVKSKGVCVTECPLNEVPNSSGECECPRSAAFIDAQGTCIPCSQQCANGCFGPNVNQCLPGPNGESGCRNVQLLDACAPRCDVGMTAGLDRICSFKCHEQCGGKAGECYGTGPHQCERCKTVSYRNTDKNRNECAASCPSLQTADDKGACQPCHNQCLYGCSTPDDASACIGGCRSYHDQGACVGDCPIKRPFAAGLGGSVCLETCPVGKLYYNDTRTEDGSGFSMPQLCVDSCSTLNRTISSDELYPYRCVTSERDAADIAAASSGLISSSSIAAIVVGCLAVIMILIAVAVVMYQRRSGSVDIRNDYGVSNYSAAKSPNHSRVSAYPVGRMSPSRDSYTFDPDRSVQNAEYFDSSVLGPPVAPRNLYPMGNNALFADYAEPSGVGADDFQTTKM